MTQLVAPRSVSSYGFGEAFRHLQQRANSAHIRFAKLRADEAIQKVAQRQENWDGFGSEKPSDVACARAAVELEGFIEHAFADHLGWQQPHVSSNEFGEISLEWWRGEKRLTVYIAADEMRYVCSWGTDINSHMDAGMLASEGFLPKWRWFRT